jgi:hypothetical protein
LAARAQRAATRLESAWGSSSRHGRLACCQLPPDA